MVGMSNLQYLHLKFEQLIFDITKNNSQATPDIDSYLNYNKFNKAIVKEVGKIYEDVTTSIC
jgi:hypothetical protein